MYTTELSAELGYATGYFEIFETLSFVYWVVSLPPPAQARLRQWFDEHLHTLKNRDEDLSATELLDTWPLTRIILWPMMWFSYRP
jgi:hypothetical protein